MLIRSISRLAAAAALPCTGRTARRRNMLDPAAPPACPPHCVATSAASNSSHLLPALLCHGDACGILTHGNARGLIFYEDALAHRFFLLSPCSLFGLS